MLKKLLCMALGCSLVLGTAAMSSCSDNAPREQPGPGDEKEPVEPTVETGIVINGVRWAEHNTADRGTFSVAVQSYGRYYTFEEALTACPEGWRLPTREELNSLLRSDSQWVANGYRFGGNNGSIFLPAAGYIDEDGNMGTESLENQGSYWSSVLTEEADFFAYTLDFNNSNNSGVGYHSVLEKRSVRCVSVEAVPEPWGQQVTISGVRWATHNIGDPGAFTTILDYGEHYTFEIARAICPEGWRLPTVAEFRSLIEVGSRWATLNGIYGRLFGSEDNILFLPAAGLRNKDLWFNPDIDGFYWTDEQAGEDHGYSLFFDSDDDDVAPDNERGSMDALTVRCVRP